MPYEVFISYSRKDIDLCDRVCDLIRSLDYDVFVDRHDLTAGENWRYQLEQVLEQAFIKPFVIVLATDAAVAKPDIIKEEIATAAANRLAIIAIQWDEGAAAVLLESKSHHYLAGKKSAGACLVEQSLERQLRWSLNSHTREWLQRQRKLAAQWIEARLPEVDHSFWGQTWESYFHTISQGEDHSASVALIAPGGSGKSVLIAHYIKNLLSKADCYPVLLGGELLHDAEARLPGLLGTRSLEDLPSHLEELFQRYQMRVVFVVDGLDQLAAPGDPGQHKLIHVLNILSDSGHLIIACRNNVWESLYADRLPITAVSVSQLEWNQVNAVLERLTELDPGDRNELLCIPFFLDLTIRNADEWENIPETETAFLQRVWSDTISTVSAAGPAGASADEGSPRQTLQTLGAMQLERLTYEIPQDELIQRIGQQTQFNQVLQSLKRLGILQERRSPIEGRPSLLRLRHDLLDNFGMIRALMTGDRDVFDLCDHMEKDCGWSVVASLMQMTHDHGDEATTRQVFEKFLEILDTKPLGDQYMARAWAVTHVLRSKFDILMPLIVEALEGERIPEDAQSDASKNHHPASLLGIRLTQTAASSLASAFMVLRRGTAAQAKVAVPILSAGLNKWDLKARFIDGLSKFGTSKRARTALIDCGRRLLDASRDGEDSPCRDDLALEYISRSLRFFDHADAVDLLREIASHPGLPSMIRRLAAESLSYLRPGSIEVPDRDETEIIAGLAVKDPDGRPYSDWHRVQDYARYLEKRHQTGFAFRARVLQALIGALAHDHPYVRAPVARALGIFDEVPARDALLSELLKDVVPADVRSACLDALDQQMKRYSDQRKRQVLRFLLIRASRALGSRGVFGSVRKILELALPQPAAGEWLADENAMEIVEPAPAGTGLRVNCDIVSSDEAELHSSVLRELAESRRDPGPATERKYRFVETSRPKVDELFIRLAETDWQTGASFLDAALEHGQRFVIDEAGAWLAPAPLGNDQFPGLAAIHAIVLTSDNRVLLTLRSAEEHYFKRHWSISFEEQIASSFDGKASDLDGIADLAQNAACRGMLEELGTHVTQDQAFPLSAVIELGNLNSAIVVLLRPEASFQQIQENWSSRSERPVDWAEAERLDSLQLHELGSLLHQEIPRYQLLHPTSRIRARMLLRWLCNPPAN